MINKLKKKKRTAKKRNNKVTFYFNVKFDEKCNFKFQKQKPSVLNIKLNAIKINSKSI